MATSPTACPHGRAFLNPSAGNWSASCEPCPPHRIDKTPPARITSSTLYGSCVLTGYFVASTALKALCPASAFLSDTPNSASSSPSLDRSASGRTGQRSYPRRHGLMAGVASCRSRRHLRGHRPATKFKEAPGPPQPPSRPPTANSRAGRSMPSSPTPEAPEPSRSGPAMFQCSGMPCKPSG